MYENNCETPLGAKRIPTNVSLTQANLVETISIIRNLDRSMDRLSSGIADKSPTCEPSEELKPYSVEDQIVAVADLSNVLLNLATSLLRRFDSIV